jgi:hypothetical protein
MYSLYVFLIPESPLHKVYRCSSFLDVPYITLCMCSSFLEAPYVMLSSFLEAAYVMIYHSLGPFRDHPSSRGLSMWILSVYVYTRRGPCGIIQNYSFERPMKTMPAMQGSLPRIYGI